MKKIILISVILFATVKICNAQPEWFWLNPSPTGKYLNSVKFINSNTGIAVGEEGTIIKTTNGGADWELDELAIDNIYALHLSNSGVAAIFISFIGAITNDTVL